MKTMKKIATFLPLALLSIGAIAAPNQAVLSWVAPTMHTDGTPIGGTETVTYTVYQGLQGQPKVKGPTGIAGLTVTINSGLLSNRTYCWDVTATSSDAPSLESAHSSEACKTFPASPLNPPTNLTVN